MEEKYRILVLNQELFNEKIVEVIDPVFIQRYWYVKASSSEEFDSILENIIPGYKEQVETTNGEEGVSDGECIGIIMSNRLVVAFWFDPEDINSISHECLHAVLYCADNRELKYKKDHEVICYMHGFLISELFEKLNLKIEVNN